MTTTATLSRFITMKCQYSIDGGGNWLNFPDVYIPSNYATNRADFFSTNFTLTAESATVLGLSSSSFTPIFNFNTTTRVLGVNSTLLTKNFHARLAYHDPDNTLGFGAKVNHALAFGEYDGNDTKGLIFKSNQSNGYISGFGTKTGTFSSGNIGGSTTILKILPSNFITQCITLVDPSDTSKCFFKLKIRITGLSSGTQGTSSFNSIIGSKIRVIFGTTVVGGTDLDEVTTGTIASGTNNYTITSNNSYSIDQTGAKEIIFQFMKYSAEAQREISDYRIAFQDSMLNTNSNNKTVGGQGYLDFPYSSYSISTSDIVSSITCGMAGLDKQLIFNLGLQNVPLSNDTYTYKITLGTQSQTNSLSLNKYFIHISPSLNSRIDLNRYLILKEQI